MLTKSRRSHRLSGALSRNQIPTHAHPQFFPRSKVSSSTGFAKARPPQWSLHEFWQASSRSEHINMRFRRVVLPFHRAVAEVDTSAGAKRRNPFGEARTGWRFSACGMVHPNVLLACGSIPTSIRGCLGHGIDRIAMLKTDVRLRQLFENDCGGSIITLQSLSTPDARGRIEFVRRR